MNGRSVRGISVAFLVAFGIAGLGARFSMAQGVASSGDAQAGKTLWEGPATFCERCHGVKGEGAFGPDLAGRQLSVAQFRQAVRKPWGIMPAFTEQQVSDQEIANMAAYFNSLPRVAEPGPWRIPIRAEATDGEKLIVATVGCGQCHGHDIGGPRRDAGAVAADFEWLKKFVYEHTTAMPEFWRLLEEEPAVRIRMGNYSRTRLPESLLQEIWRYMNDLGFRVPIGAQLSAGMTAANGVTYTLTVENGGLPGKGLTAEDILISLTLPSGSAVVSTTGRGYQGVRHDSQNNAEMAVWQVPRLGPKDKQTYTITLSRAGSGNDNLRGAVRWAKPLLGDGSNDTVNIAPPRPRAQ
ncbi:MAG: c-type cytochrome [Acidobacteria bacterium]|nr:c-type cytochrome [Acidobacteriota bacterium]